jgi:hypothetical protein
MTTGREHKELDGTLVNSDSVFRGLTSAHAESLQGGRSQVRNLERPSPHEKRNLYRLPRVRALWMSIRRA